MSTHNQFPVLLSVDISETRDHYLITVDITDFGAESVKVTSWQDSLVVMMTTSHEAGQSYYLGELEPEHYRRVIPLGFDVSEDDFYTRVTASTLTVYVSKPQARQRSAVDTRTGAPA